MSEQRGRSFFAAGWIRIVLLALIPMAVLMYPGKANAELEEISTTGTEWYWEYWTSPGDGDGSAFGRCINRETGVYLSNGWYVVDGYRYYFTSKGYARDQFRDGYALGSSEIGGRYKNGEAPVVYSWEQDAKGWRYVTEVEVPVEKDADTEEEDAETGEEEEETEEVIQEPETEIVKEYLTDCEAWIDGRLYRFDRDGYLPGRGWRHDDTEDAWYYILPSGACATGWKKSGSRWYFFDYTSGKMAEAGGHDTRMPFARLRKNYVFTETGALKDKTGWVGDGRGHWFFAGSDGKAASGWKTIKNVEYYFEFAMDGQLAASVDTEWFQDGYRLDENGQKGEDKYRWYRNGESWWYGNKKYYAADKTVYIDGWSYTFDDEGYCKYGIRLSDGFLQKYVVKGYSYTDDELYLMAAVIYCEAGNQPYEGQLAVGNVVMNRLKSSSYPNTLEEVVYQPYQFSVVNSQKFKNCLVTGGSQTALAAAKEAFSMSNNNVEGCIGFRLASGVDPNDSRYIIIGDIAFR